MIMNEFFRSNRFKINTLEVHLEMKTSEHV